MSQTGVIFARAVKLFMSRNADAMASHVSRELLEMHEKNTISRTLTAISMLYQFFSVHGWPLAYP